MFFYMFEVSATTTPLSTSAPTSGTSTSLAGRFCQAMKWPTQSK